MKLQVLVSTMHQKDYSLLERMNIQTDAIIINQCDRNEFKEFEFEGHKIRWLSLNERGIGLSRNTALMRADADILLFADDDIVYYDGYAECVLRAFEKYPRAQMIMFNFQSLNTDRPEIIVKRDYSLHLYNCLKFGAFRIAIRKAPIRKANITFSLLFGGGTKHQAGEDNLFITNCLQKRLKGIACSSLIGTVKQEVSTWFKGYNEKYYFDRGKLFTAMYGKKAFLYLLLFELKNVCRSNDITLLKRVKLEYQGCKDYLKESDNKGEKCVFNNSAYL